MCKTGVKVYIDHNILSARTKQDMPDAEQDAIDKLSELSRQGALDLRVSELHRREFTAAEFPAKADVAEDYGSLPKVTFIEDHHLLGFNTVSDYLGGFTSSPLIEDDEYSVQLRKHGLDRTDAHHVMLAIRDDCSVFLTCDERSILRHRKQIEQAFPSIRLLKPTELVAELSSGSCQGCSAP